MKEILCVVDFSGATGKVLEVAARIASACNAHLIVVYPYRLLLDPTHEGDMMSLKRKIEAQAREKFQFLRSTLEVLKDVSVDFQPEIGFLADRIHAYTRKKNIDMIIIGQPQAGSETDIRNLNFQDLISNSQLPFVIVPAEI